MTLGDELLAELPNLRMHAESRMVDSCVVVSNPDAGTVWDPVTLSEVDAPETFSYTGPVLVKAGRTQPRDVDAVGQSLIETVLEAHFPMATSTEIRPGHVVRVTSSVTDPGLVGREFRVTGPHAGTFLTARRFPIEEVGRG